MGPLVVGGEAWRVRTVPPSDPSLVDRTGIARPATTDPLSRTVNIASNVAPPFLDAVLLHEAAHAITVSHGLLPLMRKVFPEDMHVAAEEWLASALEKYSVEAIIAVSESLGRPLCINGKCLP